MKHYLPFILIGFLLFVAGGDKVFPGAIGQASTQTRTAINKFFIGLSPSWKPKTKPYERTEKQLREAEEQK
ncbi:hypothetical protein Cylst_3731 [Cylindrospermum stagnale PCC 7417]|uniref:Uncharacterized protein n=1 Tax=Cylindrospermum stagnale PCC 7417 TaxID=56107 RepID=K9X1A9_9NOST|nr:hypothetical protein [Cylindrospermum stagnale]AFZ25854.1 hypothetical protein Cylst_3731 [Cylindrospermum stagnale PCC 7417]